MALLRDRPNYSYLDNWDNRAGNTNIEPERLGAWLAAQGVAPALASRAIFELQKVSSDTSQSLHDRNRKVYRLLRYDVKLKPEAGENTVTVWLIDWQRPQANDFAFAQEVTVKAANAKASAKRPGIVLYGLALGVLELKRSTVSVSEGIRPFFSTLQWMMAGNDSEGLRYGTTDTSEKYYLQWVEDGSELAAEPRLLDRHGNAMLVAGSIYEAWKYYELFSKTELKGKCTIVSSYAPTLADAKGEISGAGDTDNLFNYGVYRQMLADCFHEPPELAQGKADQFELAVKRKFINEPGQMEPLTGFNADDAKCLLENRLDKAWHDLKDAPEAVKALCELSNFLFQPCRLRSLFLRQKFRRRWVSQGERSQTPETLQVHRPPAARLCGHPERSGPLRQDA